jgi:type II secretory ATPase GspE/PulE/Tfp pilus assembly ATPase PilB-like protein
MIDVTTTNLSARIVLILVLAMAGALCAAQASDVILVDGGRFEDVQIVERNAELLQIRVAQGTIWIDMKLVASINGIPVRPPSPAANRQAVAPTFASQQRSGPPSVSRPPVQPARQAKPRPATAPATPKIDYVHDWRFEKTAAIAAGVCVLWLMLLVGGNRLAWSQCGEDVHRVRLWNLANLILPGAAVAIFLVARLRVSMARREGWRSQAPETNNRAPLQVPLDEPRGKPHRIPLSSTRSTRERRIDFEFLDPDGKAVEVRHDAAEMTGLELAQDIIEEAIVMRGSDVHLEPHEKGYRVRVRVDGLLQERGQYERPEGQRALLALKALAQIDLAAKQAALDGRFRIRSGTRDIDVRAATTTSIFGEKLVLRILDRKRGVLSLGDIGMGDAARTEFERLIHARTGMILATGPTGCGKTTTLYSALSTLDHRQLNIMTIEDPVEYQLEGATQISVNPRAGVTYESGLRSILRQDPDVILVGEMRDAEAATIAIRAALAGHLVLSSLHTNDALTTIVRLEEMGVEQHRMSAALLMVIAQRLVRVLCRECRELHEPTPQALASVGLTDADAKLIYRAVGCPSCDGTGYQGRTAIFELLVMDDDLRQAVAEGATPQALAQLARRKGFKTYREDGAAKILAGITSVEEVQLAG